MKNQFSDLDVLYCSPRRVCSFNKACDAHNIALKTKLTSSVVYSPSPRQSNDFKYIAKQSKEKVQINGNAFSVHQSNESLPPIKERKSLYEKFSRYQQELKHLNRTRIDNPEDHPNSNVLGKQQAQGPLKDFMLSKNNDSKNKYDISNIKVSDYILSKQNTEKTKFIQQKKKPNIISKKLERKQLTEKLMPNVQKLQPSRYPSSNMYNYRQFEIRPMPQEIKQLFIDQNRISQTKESIQPQTQKSILPKNFRPNTPYHHHRFSNPERLKVRPQVTVQYQSNPVTPVMKLNPFDDGTDQIHHKKTYQRSNRNIPQFFQMNDNKQGQVVSRKKQSIPLFQNGQKHINDHQDFEQVLINAHINIQNQDQNELTEEDSSVSSSISSFKDSHVLNSYRIGDYINYESIYKRKDEIQTNQIQSCRIHQ